MNTERIILFAVVIATATIVTGCSDKSSSTASFSLKGLNTSKDISESIEKIQKEEQLSEEGIARAKKILKIAGILDVNDPNSAYIHLAVLQLAKVAGYVIDDKDGSNHC